MGAVKTAVPMQNREWLRLFRKLKGYTVHGLAHECGICHVTYISVESGGKKSSRPCSTKTINIVSNKLGIKVDLFYYRCDENGKLVDKSAITDIFTLFSINGFKGVIHSEEAIRSIFSEELAEFIIDNILIDEYLK